MIAGQASSLYQRCESREGLTCLKDSICRLDCVWRGKAVGTVKRAEARDQMLVPDYGVFLHRNIYVVVLISKPLPKFSLLVLPFLKFLPKIPWRFPHLPQSILSFSECF